MKLMDESENKKGKKISENLTLQNLIDHAKKHNTLKSNDISKITELYSQIYEFRKVHDIFRNKFLAHNDIEFFLNTPQDYEFPTLKEVVSALDLITKILNIMQLFKYNTETYYDQIVESSGVDSLISNLKVSIHYEKLKRKRLINSDYWYPNEIN